MYVIFDDVKGADRLPPNEPLDTFALGATLSPEDGRDEKWAV